MVAKSLGVLLIEDSALIRRSLTEAINASPHLEVAAFAETPGDALALLRAQAFDAVIVDLQLRGGSGIDVLAFLKGSGLGDQLLAVVLTNHALPAYRERCVAYGARYFFDKSFEFDRVIEVLDRYAQDRHQRHSAAAPRVER